MRGEPWGFPTFGEQGEKEQEKNIVKEEVPVM